MIAQYCLFELLCITGMSLIRIFLQVKSWLKLIIKNIFSPYLLILLSFPLHALEVKDFIREADLRDLEVSPDGKHLAAVWNQGTTRFVTIQDLTKEGAPVVAKLGDNVRRPSYVQWGSNERLLITLLVPYNTARVESRAKKDEDFDIYDYAMAKRTIAIDVDGQNPVALLTDSALLRRNSNLSRVHHFLRDDPHHILMIAYKTNSPYLMKVNLLTGNSEVVTKGRRSTVRFISDEHGKLRYRLDYLRRAKAIVVYEFMGNEKWKRREKIYFDDEEKNSIDIKDLVGTIDEKLVYLRRSDESGYLELVTRVVGPDDDEVTKEKADGEPEENQSLEGSVTDTESVDVEGAETIIVSLDNKDVLGVLTSRYTDEVVGYRFENEDVIEHHYFGENTQSFYEKVKTKVREYTTSGFRIISVSSGRRYSIVKTNGADDPGMYFLFENDTETLSLYGFSHEHLTAANLATAAVATYATRDNVGIRSYILFPNDYDKTQKAPLIVMPHGGPQARDYAYFDYFAQFLATRGYIVMQPNFRGSTGYGKAFEEAGYKQWGGLMQQDIEDAAHYMIRKGYVDADNICIAGISYGGYAALMGVIKTPEVFKCAVAMSAVTDLPKMMKYDRRKFKEYPDVMEKFYKSVGHPVDDTAMLIANSPARLADKVGAPILLVAGTKDTVVPFSQAKLMRKALKKADKDFEFIKLKDTGHNPIYYTEDIEIVYKAVEEFLAEYLVK